MRMVALGLIGFLCLVLPVSNPITTLQSKPMEVSPSEAKIPAIGSVVSDQLRFKDIHFKQRTLSEKCFADKKAFVFLFVNGNCPLVPRYLPMIVRMEKEYRVKGVQFLAINVGLHETLPEIAQQGVEFQVEFPFVKDIEGSCLAELGAQRTPEVVVLNAKKEIAYRGRINDQYAPSKVLPKPTREDLKEALDEILDGKKVSISSTTVEGCKIARPTTAPEEQKITYAEHIAPLLHKHCLECHRLGGLAPKRFEFTSYEKVEKNAEMIEEVVADGQMPPFYVAHGYAKISNDRRLSVEERSLFSRWIKSGKPRGDESKFPIPQVKPIKKEDWAFGEPDLILETPVETIPAEGDVPYRYALLPHTFWQETWIQSIEIKPDNPGVVHHANLLYASVAEVKINDGLFVTGFVPGNVGANYDEGMAYRMPPLSRLLFQIHFVSTGKVEKCKLQIGIRYPRKPVDKQVKHILHDLERFRIPANNPAHHIAIGEPLKHDAIAVGFFVHMHKLGQSMTFKAKLPNEEEKNIFLVPNYSFDWQVPYKIEHGTMRFPKGTYLSADAIYDNSSFNINNPNPNRIVPSGFQTYNEMMQGFFFYVDANEKLNLTIDPKTGVIKRSKK